MRARYLGDHDSVTSWGIRFPRGVFVDVSGETALRKIPGNPDFEVSPVDAETVEFREIVQPVAEPRRKPGRKPKAE